MRSARLKGNTAGFSLIELTIALAIVGLIAVTALASYRVYLKKHADQTSQIRREKILVAIAKYVTEKGRFPRPASRSENLDDASSGQEQPAPATQCAAAGGVGLCWNDGARTPCGFGSPPRIYIGAVPYVELGLTREDSLDGWANKMTYAVSANLTVPQAAGPTDPQKYVKGKGVINLLTRQWDQTFDTVLVNTAADDLDPATPPACTVRKSLAKAFSFVLISHGPDGAGAYSYSGSYRACPAAGTTRDVENCNDDSKFVADEKKSMPPGPQHNDDSVVAYQIPLVGKWEPPQPGAGGTLDYTVGKQDYGVGIGTLEVQARLDVASPPNVLGVTNPGAIGAQQVWAPQYCSDDSNKYVPASSSEKKPPSGEIIPKACFKTGLIVGGGGNCNGGVMLGFSGGGVVCMTSVSAPAPSVNKRCPSGKFMVGFSSSGGIRCCDPDWTSATASSKCTSL